MVEKRVLDYLELELSIHLPQSLRHTTITTVQPPPAWEQPTVGTTYKSVVTPGTSPETSTCRCLMYTESNWIALAGKQQLALW